MARPSSTLFKKIDPDKLLSHVLPIIRGALIAWQSGMNSDEGALMNQITSAFNKRRARRCDIGTNGSVRVESELFELHRQGLSTTDQYGSDLAITVTSTDEPNFVKTTFLQFKIADGHKVDVEANQITDAAVYDEVFERAFCIAFEPINHTIRLQSLEKLKARFPEGQSTRRYNTESWISFGDWLISWLNCTIGAVSTPDEQRSIENLLQEYTLRESSEFAPSWNLEPSFYPAKSWMKMKFKP